MLALKAALLLIYLVTVVVAVAVRPAPPPEPMLLEEREIAPPEDRPTPAP